MNYINDVKLFSFGQMRANFIELREDSIMSVAIHFSYARKQPVLVDAELRTDCFRNNRQRIVLAILDVANDSTRYVDCIREGRLRVTAQFPDLSEPFSCCIHMHTS